jgi:hypothetical protein
MSTPDLSGADDFTTLADRVAASLRFPEPDQPPSGSVGYLPEQ